MRKLLVARQKGGVGKTTTSINLAAAAAMAGARVLLLEADPVSGISTSLNLTQHPRRQTLRQLGIDLPGVLVNDVLPGLDVLSPYEEGGCTDEELDDLLSLLSAPDSRECCATLIVDTPPFLGPNPAQLLATAEEFLLVMRAEPMAARTLPAFLELVQRSRKGSPIRLRGILLTLPEGEQVGGRCERELRGRFASRILPFVVPFDGAVGEASLSAQIVSHVARESIAAVIYHGLVENLQLSANGDSSERPSVAAALLRASAGLKARPPRKPPTVRKPSNASVPVLVMAGGDAPPKRPMELEPVSLAEFDEVPEPIKRRMTPAATIPAVLKEKEKKETLRPAATAPESPPAPVKVEFPLAQGVIWFGLAIIIGVGLRFLNLPPSSIPYIVGVAVSAVVILVVRALMPPGDEAKQESAARSGRGVRKK